MCQRELLYRSVCHDGGVDLTEISYQSTIAQLGGLPDLRKAAFQAQYAGGWSLWLLLLKAPTLQAIGFQARYAGGTSRWMHLPEIINSKQAAGCISLESSMAHQPVE